MSKFMYLRDSYDEARAIKNGEELSYRKGQPIGCVAFSADGDTLAYQFSVLNPSDKFDRARGRAIAGGRLEKTPIRVELPGAGTMSYQALLTAVMSCVAATPEACTRAVKAAKGWLAQNVH
jgi:hypothetical protein